MLSQMAFSYKYLFISFIISIITGVLVYLFFPFYEIKGAERALDGVLLLSSISLGFYGACLSVLASISNTKVVKEIMKDEDDKKEFLIISSITLLIGFFTVIATIFYQVLLENGQLNLNLVNSIWFFIIYLFFSMQLLFILVIFMILFNNKEDNNENTDVYIP